MKKLKDNRMFFKNDDEFINFCLKSDPTIYHNDEYNFRYFDYDFTDEYNNAINNGINFIINDPNSLVFKRKAVNKGLITKPIQNLFACNC